jgi:hypothetical protein
MEFDTLEYSRVKATMVSMQMRIYLCALTNTNTHHKRQQWCMQALSGKKYANLIKY